MLNNWKNRYNSSNRNTPAFKTRKTGVTTSAAKNCSRGCKWLILSLRNSKSCAISTGWKRKIKYRFCNNYKANAWQATRKSLNEPGVSRISKPLSMTETAKPAKMNIWLNRSDRLSRWVSIRVKRWPSSERKLLLKRIQMKRPVTKSKVWKLRLSQLAHGWPTKSK